MAYQSISGSGDSDSAGKLTALRLPDLTGKTFLDIGCNEGYFCNAALAAGAASAVGVDASKGAIALARRHFPKCEFINSDWDSFLAENMDRFDVILCASALHYAKDQRAFLERLLNTLTEDGLLILECGLADGAEDMVTVQRGDGPKQYFTKKSITDFFERLGYRITFFGDSAKQHGDSVPRYALHIQRPKRSIILNSTKPDSGKSQLGASLKAFGIPTLSLDDIARRLTNNQKDGPLANGADDLGRVWLLCQQMNLNDAVATTILRELPNDAGTIYVEGWMPDEMVQTVIRKMTDAGFIVHTITASHGSFVKRHAPAVTGLRLPSGHYTMTTIKGSVDNISMPSETLLIVSGWYDREINPIKLHISAADHAATSGPISIFERKDTAEFGLGFTTTVEVNQPLLEAIKSEGWSKTILALETEGKILRRFPKPVFTPAI